MLTGTDPAVLAGFDLDGRTAVVTGAAQGFGRAIVTHLLALGADVVALDRREGPWIEELAADGVDARSADITDAAGLADVFTGLHARGTTADILVNNAGVFSNFLTASLTIEEFARVQRINVWGQLLCARSWAAQDLASRPGRAGPALVQISSVDAERPSAEGLVHYTTSKHGAAGLVRALARELAPRGIRCNAVCPGAAMTEGAIELVTTGAPAGIDVEAQWDGIVDRTPLRRLVDPTDVAHLAGFLASAASEPLTGQILAVDGGMLASPLEGYVPATGGEAGA